MSDLIGKEVYVEVRDSATYYSSNSLEWQKGSIVGVFVGGDVLVEYGSEKLIRDAQANVAFTDEAPPKLKVVMTSPTKPEEGAKTK